MSITSRERPPWGDGPPPPTSVLPPPEGPTGKPRLLALLVLVPVVMLLPWLGRCMFFGKGCASPRGAAGADGGGPGGEGDGTNTPWWDDGSGGPDGTGGGGPFGPNGDGGPVTNADGILLGPDGLPIGSGSGGEGGDDGSLGLPTMDLSKCLLYGERPRWLNPRAGSAFALAEEEVVQARSIGCLSSSRGDRVSPDTFPGTNVTYVQHEYDPLIHGTTFTYRVCSSDVRDGATLKSITFGHVGECCLLSTSYFGGTAEPGVTTSQSRSSGAAARDAKEVLSDAYSEGSIRAGVDDDTCSYGVTFTRNFPRDGTTGCEMYELTYLGYVPSSLDVPVTFLLSTPPTGTSTPDRPVDTPPSRLDGGDVYFRDSLGGGADCSVDGWDFTTLPDGRGVGLDEDDRPVDRFQSRPLDVVEGEDGWLVDGPGSGGGGLDDNGRPIDRPGLPGDVEIDGTDGGGPGTVGRPIDRPGGSDGMDLTDVDGADDTGGSIGGRPIDRPGGEVTITVDGVDDPGTDTGGIGRPIDRPGGGGGGDDSDRPFEGVIDVDGGLIDGDSTDVGGGDGTRPIDRPGQTPERPTEGGGGDTGLNDDIDGDELLPPGVDGTRPLDRPPPPGQTWPPTVPPRPVPTRPTRPVVDDGGVDGDSIDAPPDPIEDSNVDRPIDRLECREAMFVGVGATADIPIRTMKVEFV